MKQRVLLIAYYFPPLGGAGVSRPMALFKHLPDFGIDVDVLTVKPVAYRTYEPELMADLDVKKIYRSRSFDPQRIMYLMGMRKVKEKTIGRGKKVSDRFFPDPKIGWVKSAVKLGRILLENKQHTCIISTSPPMSTHLIAYKLSQEFAVPWIADFRDYWTSYKPENWFDDKRSIERAKELYQIIEENSRVITTVSKPIADYLHTDKIIHNSYDEKIASLWQSPSTSDNFTIGVLGTLDKLCPIQPLINALVLLREKEPEVFNKLKVVQVGNINDPEFEPSIQNNNLNNIFEIHNHQSRKRTIELLNQTQMLYLGINPDYESGIITSRLFDMLASGRLLLCAVSDDSEIGKIVTQSGQSCCFRNNMLDKALVFINENVQKWESNGLHITPLPEYASRFGSKRMVEKFVSIIEETGRKS